MTRRTSKKKVTTKARLLEDSKTLPGYKVIPLKNKDVPKLMFLNAPRFGLEYFPKEELRGLLEYAKVKGVDGLCITGDLFYIDLKKYSKNKIIRSRSETYYVNEDDIYMPEILKDPDFVQAPWEKDFIVTSEILKSMERELIDLFEVNKSYNIPIYLVPGHMEYDLILSLTTDEVRDKVRKKENAVDNLVKNLRKQIKKSYEIARQEKASERMRIKTELEDKGVDKKDLESMIEAEFMNKASEIDKKAESTDSAFQKTIDELKVYKKRINMSNYNKIKELYDVKYKQIKDSLEKIPGLTMLDADGKLDVNGIPVEFRYNVSQISDTPTKQAVTQMRKYLVSKVEKSGEPGYLVPRYFVQGGLNGNYVHEVIRDSSFDDKERFEEFLIPSIRNERYLFANQAPPFVFEEKIIELMDSDPKIANDATQKMMRRFKTTSGAIIAYFVHESCIPTGIITNNQLFKVNQAIEAKGDIESIINTPSFLKYFKSDSHQGSGFIKKVLFSEEEHKDIIDKSGLTSDEIPFMYNDLNRVFNLFKHLIPYITSMDDQGDPTQAKNYPTETEKHPLIKERIHLDDILLAIERGEDLGRFYKGEFLDFLRRNPRFVNKELQRLNFDLRNLTTATDQIDRWIKEEYLDFKDDFERMIRVSEISEYEGPIDVILQGNHEQHTYSKVGLDVSREFARAICLNAFNTLEDPRVLPGSIGSGTGFAKYSCGIKNHYNYYFKELHKSHKSLNDQWTAMTEAANKEQLRVDVMASGHTHYPAIVFDGRLFVQNGSTQSDNEWKEIIRLPPAKNCFYLLGLPVDGFNDGEIIFVPITAEFAVNALRSPPLIDKTLSVFNIWKKEEIDKELKGEA